MSDTRQGLDGLAIQLMVVLCCIWGLQQVAIKLAAPDMAPVDRKSTRLNSSHT
mgnify:CR=1 FL=1